MFLSGELIIAFSLFFFFILLSLGSFVFSLFNRFLHYNETILDIFEKINLYLFLGTVSIPLIVIFWSILGHSLNTITLYFTLLISILFFFLKKRDTIIDYNGRLNVKQCVNILFLLKILIFLTSLLFYLYPTLGLYDYPGHDVLAYSFVAIRIIEDRGYTLNVGRIPFVAPSFHFLIFGFPSITAFFYFLTSLPIGLLSLILICLYRGLLPLSIYCFVKKFSGKEEIGIATAFSTAFLLWSQVDYFSWGGVGESVAYFMAPTIIWLAIDFLRESKHILCKLFSISILIAIETIMHPYGTILILTFIIWLIIYYSINRRSIRPILYFFLIITFSTVLLLPHILLYVNVLRNILGTEFQLISISKPFSEDYYLRNWRWRLVPIRPGMTFPQILDNLHWIFKRYIGETITLLGLLGLISLFHRRGRSCIYLFLWILFLFTLAENSPYGLYFVQFPFSHQIPPPRIYFALGIPMACLSGYGIFWSMYNVKLFLDKFIELIFKTRRIRIRIRIKNSLINIPIHIFVYGILMLVLFSTVGVFSTINNNFRYLLDSRRNTLITYYDYEAFKWIIENTNEDALFLVRCETDAGTWIPMYTGRRIISYHPLRQWGPLFNEAKIMLKKLIKYGIIDDKIIDLFLKYKIDYVYIGAKNLGEMKLTYETLSNTARFKLVYRNEKVYIFKFEP